MARGTFLGRSRTIRQAEAVSSTTSKHSDARPRKDLKCIEDGANHGRQVPHAHRDFQRPETSEGRQQKRLQALSPVNTQAPPLPSSPMLSPTGTDNGANGSLIGVALGSPRMIESHVPMSQTQETPPAKPAETQTRPALQRKPSKWKKIGGLFKAKAAMTAAPNQPFYQVRLEDEWPMQDSTYSFEQQPRVQPEKPASPTSGTEAWPSLEPEIQHQAHEKERSEGDVNFSPKADKQPPATGPLLQVEIPDIQLERYSVMFGGVLSKNRPPSLIRRSQTLQDVSAPAPEAIPPMPELEPPRRRATSPTRSKSPSFTLFPSTQVSKASKVLGSQNIPRGPSPLHKSQTSLAESHQESVSEKNSLVLMVHQPSHKPQNSMSSFLSSTTIGSEDEQLLVQKLGPVRSYIDAREPEWEIINKRPANETPQPAPPALRIDTQMTSSETNSYESTLSPANNTPVNAPRSENEALSPASRMLSPTSPRRMSPGKEEEKMNPTEPTNPAPAVEISIARSVSVSRGRRQVLVPIRPRQDRPDPSERTDDRVKSPRVVTGNRNRIPPRSKEALNNMI
ncbi:hypothetical protein BO94DRAFT_316839 [Aspergillus sclerotioniger CBS 115572]|uniref:Uncharacterized protein n=1 Tax=Aspergillus sclerotioniger CBS 115572 TaxID=1450535 RepID=A0A317X611_9EURO|nr:hypothetical protein BO94DRAFT_316839 [Aspergillus sclerotioniger CBS 115572]PWY93999.1 hypothetical protein BO94DRAFT_316839 [Aspergillus sclerotioniger CBS 115572]